MSSSFGMKLSSPTNSVSRPNRRLDRNCRQSVSSAAPLVMYCSCKGVVTGCLLGWTERTIGRPHGLCTAETQVFLQKLIGFEHASQFRFGAPVSLIGIRMKHLRLLSERGGHIGQGAAELDAHDRIGIHCIIDASGALRQVPPAPAGRLQHVGKADSPPAAPWPLADLAVEIVPPVFDEFQPRFQAHGSGHIADLLELFLNLEQGLDNLVESLLDSKVAIDTLLHHCIDGDIHAVFSLRAQGPDSFVMPLRNFMYLLEEKGIDVCTPEDRGIVA